MMHLDTVFTQIRRWTSSPSTRASWGPADRVSRSPPKAMVIKVKEMNDIALSDILGGSTVGIHPWELIPSRRRRPHRRPSAEAVETTARTRCASLRAPYVVLRAQRRGRTAHAQGEGSLNVIERCPPPSCPGGLDGGPALHEHAADDPRGTSPLPSLVTIYLVSIRFLSFTVRQDCGEAVEARTEEGAGGKLGAACRFSSLLSSNGRKE